MGAPSEADTASISFANMSDDERKVMARRIKRKLDIRVVPACALLWLMAFLDRASIGNANAANPSLSKSLGLVGLQYSTCLALFYILYVCIEIPSNIVLSKIGGKIWLPFIVAAWGIVTIGTGFVQNYGGLIAIRLLLGLCEGGLLPGIVLYLAQLYKRHELAQRIAYFYASASISGAFGGLLAAGFIKIPTNSAVDAGWRWIFIMEGIITVLIAALTYFMLPADVRTAKCLTPDERIFAAARLHEDFLQAPLPDSIDQEKDGKLVGRVLTIQPEEEQFEMYEVVRGIRDPQVWMTGISYMCLCVSLYSFSLFVPTIIRGIRPDVDTVTLQLLTVPIYVPAAAVTVLVATFSDRLKMRGPVVLLGTPLNMIGYIMLIVSADPQVQYAALFLVALGLYPVIPAVLTILPNNSSGKTKRATTGAMQLIIANCAAYPATFIYTADIAPRYVRAHAIVLGFMVLAWIMFAANTLYCIYENRARAAGKRDGNIAKYEALYRAGKTKAPIGDRHPSFRFTI